MKKIVTIILIISSIIIFWAIACKLIVNILWFQEVGYLAVFLTQIQTKLILWLFSILTYFFLFGNLILAEKWIEKNIIPKDNNPVIPDYKLEDNMSKSRKKLLSKFPIFMMVVITLSLMTILILWHHITIIINSWNYTTFNQIPNGFQPSEFLPIIQQVLSQPWQIIIIIALTITILIYPQLISKILGVIISFSLGLILSKNWDNILLFFNYYKFNYNEPIFGKDISFYIFQMPVLTMLELILYSLSLYSLISVTIVYLLSNNSFSNGGFSGFSTKQLRHLYLLSSCFMGSVTFKYWLNRYQLLYSPRGIIYGASYTDINIELPGTNVLIIIGTIASILLIIQTLLLVKSWRKLIIQVSTVLAVGTATTWFLPATVQKIIVQPNELSLEKPYIENTIKFTRSAFNLDNIEAKTFNPQGKLTQLDLQNNRLTINNIRIWDDRPLLSTNRQLQQIRLYYKFVSADIDRYILPNEKAQFQKQQIIISPRELDYDSVPQNAQTWVNQHLVYTHGYGFTITPVNTVESGGLPEYFIKDIGSDTDTGNNGILWTKNPLITQSIPVENPRIYYGELTDNYIFTGTKIKELDYPSGTNNVFNVYDGLGGIKFNTWWKKIVFATYFKDRKILFTESFKPETKILLRRKIKERVKAIAPFLTYDSDPYLVVAKNADNPQTKTNKTPSYLYWVIDGYTTSKYYPYSEPGKEKINYIRNSVKVVINAYHGDVKFYVATEDDPIIKTWQKILPKTFQPLTEMPQELRYHLRYPIDLFNIQSERLLNYHITDARVFYNKEDSWQVPTEIYGNKPQPVEPYYLIMKLPSAKSEEFILLLPFTPTQRTNLVGWLAARADGEDYGKLLLYQFPKQQLVYGTEQIEALINQDPEISQQISLWNRQGSRVIQGNLLIIPIENALLYVEPLYLEAEQNSLPTLARVVVAYENRIVMAETLEKALTAIFKVKS